MQIEYSPNFIRKYRKIPREIIELVEEKEKVFRSNSFDPRLKTHKLSGRLDGYYSFSVNYRYRIIFRFINSIHVWFHTIGDHDIYD